jgi:deoxyribose-phosphate aldolase
MENVLSLKNFVTLRLNEQSLPLITGNDILLSKIDYTLLKPEATEKDIIELCAKADKLGVKSVCVLPKMVKTAKEELKDSPVLVCTVVSFPYGTDSTEEKLRETSMCIQNGADEVDMVMNYKTIYDAMEGDPEYDEAVMDIDTLVKECHFYKNKNNEPITLKVIVESGLLNEEQTNLVTWICIDAGADFIKTSTGMVMGAELEKVQIMKQIINEEGSKMKIKASGGLRTLADLQKFNPLVDRFGVGFAAVDKIFLEGGESKDSY